MENNIELKKNNEQIKLSEIVDIVKRFNHGEAKEQTLNELGEKMYVRNYLPILEKYKYLCLLIFKMNISNEEKEFLILEKYKNLFFYVLLGGYGAIEIDDENLVQYEIMDLLYPIFTPFLLQYCEKDYTIFNSMIQDVMNLYNLEELNNIMESFDYKEIEKAAEENKRLIENLNNNKDLIQNLKNISLIVDPGTKRAVKILDEVQQEKIISDINKKSKNRKPVKK